MAEAIPMGIDYYSILKLPKAAGAAEIRKAYSRLSMLHHPDRGGSHEIMI